MELTTQASQVVKSYTPAMEQSGLVPNMVIHNFLYTCHGAVRACTKYGHTQVLYTCHGAVKTSTKNGDTQVSQVVKSYTWGLSAFGIWEQTPKNLWDLGADSLKNCGIWEQAPKKLWDLVADPEKFWRI